MNVKTRLGLFAVFAVGTMTAIAEDKEPAEVTLKGEVVDLACYLDEGQRGPVHEKCAKSCIKGGTPAGLLMDDGTLYLIVTHGADGKEVLGLAAHLVELTGQIREKGGLKGLMVKKVKDLGLVKDDKEGEPHDHEGGDHK